MKQNVAKAFGDKCQSDNLNSGSQELELLQTVEVAQ
jgi:hypothetical protein